MAAAESANESVELRFYVEVLKRRSKVIGAVALAAVVVSLALTLRQEKQYRADADVLLSAASSTESLVNDSSLQIYAQSFNVARQLTNAVRSFESGNTRDAVARRYDGPLDPDDVAVSVDSSTSDVVSVHVTSSDPKAAAELVNLYVDTFISLQRQQRSDDIAAARDELQRQLDDLGGRIATIRQPLTDVERQLQSRPGDSDLESRRDDLTQSLAAQLTPLQNRQSSYQQQLEDLSLSAGIVESGGVRLLTKAEVPTEPVAPKPLLTAMIALILGLMVGVVAAFLRDTLDERLRGMADLDRAAPGVPLMATVPETRGPIADTFVAVRDDPRGLVAESFRSLRTSVKFAGLDAPLRIIQVTSSLPGEGKTTTAANLAEALAQGGERVVIVCCDLRRPRIQKRFGQSLGPGFTDVLLREVGLAQGLRSVHKNLYLLPAGTPPPNPSELLSSERAAAVFAALAAEFDTVIIDSTPVLPVTDALVVSRLVDAVLVVVNPQSTKRKALKQTLQQLEQVAAPVTGLVLLGVGANDSYTYGYGFGYSYDEPAEGSERREPAATAARRA